MGTWDSDPFGNDDACDWSYSLEETDDLSLIESSIERIFEIGGEYLEAPEASCAIAAADTLARLRGHFYVRNSSTETVDEWVADHQQTPPRKLLDSAIRALDRIQSDPSELKELWEETEDYAAWEKHIEDLKARLR